MPLDFSDYEYVLAFSLNYPLPPPELGSLFAFVGNDTEKKQSLELVNCTEVLSESVIDASSNGNIRFGHDSHTLCLNPKKAMTSKFADGLGSGPESLSIVLMPCY